METKIYSVFPACGKTYMFNNQEKFGLKILDSDSSEFKWTFDSDGNKNINPSFVEDYVNHIKSAKESGKYNYIFVSSHDVVRDALTEAGIYFKIIYPDRSLKAEWIGRCYLRPYNGFKLETLATNWDSWIDGCEDYPEDKRIVLKSGQYLCNVIECGDIRIKINTDFKHYYEEESINHSLSDIIRNGGCPVFIRGDRDLIDMHDIKIGTAIGWLVGVDDNKYAIIRIAPWAKMNAIDVQNLSCRFSIVGQFYSKKENKAIYRVDRIRHAFLDV